MMVSVLLLVGATWLNGYMGRRAVVESQRARLAGDMEFAETYRRLARRSRRRKVRALSRVVDCAEAYPGPKVVEFGSAGSSARVR